MNTTKQHNRTCLRQSLTHSVHAQQGSRSWVCLSVCPSSHISPLEHLFVLKKLSRTQRAMEVKKLWSFSETAPLQRSSTPSVESHVQSAILHHACMHDMSIKASQFTRIRGGSLYALTQQVHCFTCT